MDSGRDARTTRTISDYDLTSVAVTDNVNQSKGDGTRALAPPVASAHCQYAVDWVLVKFRWNLTVDPTERASLDGLLGGACGATVVTAPQKGTASAPTPSGLAVSRIAGSDRYQVAVNVSKNFPTGVPVVYIAKGTDYPDALAAGPAAAKAGGPVLLVTPTAVPTAVEQELQRLQPQKIVVVGGTASVQPAVYNQPRDVRAGGHPGRRRRPLCGVTSPREYAFGESGASRVYVTTGANYPDALSASPAAGTRGGAVLQVPGAAATLDPAAADLIRSLHPDDIAIAGGPNSVSAGIEQALNGLGAPGGVLRLAGTDRFEASQTINHDAFPAANQVFVATGLNFPDALAGGAFAARVHAPLYVVPGTCVPQSTLADIKALNPAQMTILGGPNSVSAAVESLTPCITPLSGSLSPSCSPSQTTLSAYNPNPFAVTVSVDVDGRRRPHLQRPGTDRRTAANLTPARTRRTTSRCAPFRMDVCSSRRRTRRTACRTPRHRLLRRSRRRTRATRSTARTSPTGRSRNGGSSTTSRTTATSRASMETTMELLASSCRESPLTEQGSLGLGSSHVAMPKGRSQTPKRDFWA